MIEVSICGLGVTSPTVPLDAIVHFGEDSQEHVLERRCALGICPMKKEGMLTFPPRRSRSFFDDVPGLHPAVP